MKKIKRKKITLAQYGKIMEKIIAKNNPKQVSLTDTFIELLEAASKYDIEESK